MEDKEDRLSNLPKIILHDILLRLLSEDVDRTFLLSKAWLETWYTFPFLYLGNFDVIITGTFSQPMEELSRRSKDFIEYVKRRLLRFWNQRLAIKEFNFTVLGLRCMSNDLDFCLKLVSESSVEVLELCLPDGGQDEKDRGECYILPKCVIEVKSLTKLTLEGGIKVDQAFMNHSIKFFSLRELHLLHVILEDERAIERFISCCPLIEIITLMLFRGSMKSLSMHGLQKLNTVYVDGIKEIYIDEAPNLKSLYYCYDGLNAPFKFDFIHSKYIKELLLCLNSTTIITEEWFLDIFPKFPFLETLEIWNCKLSEMINISSVQLKYLDVSNCSNLKEANIDAPNLLACKFDGFKGSKPIISFLNISTQLKVHLSVLIDEDLDVIYVRELLQNIKPQNVVISLSLSIFYSVGAPKPVFLDIPSPPPSIKHMDLNILSELDETLYSDIVDFILLCCIPETISWDLDTRNCEYSSRAFIEFFYETLKRRKDDTKCWWRDLKGAGVIRATIKYSMLKSVPNHSTEGNITSRQLSYPNF